MCLRIDLPIAGINLSVGCAVIGGDELRCVCCRSGTGWEDDQVYMNACPLGGPESALSLCGFFGNAERLGQGTGQ